MINVIGENICINIMVRSLFLIFECATDGEWSWILGLGISVNFLPWGFQFPACFGRAFVLWVVRSLCTMGQGPWGSLSWPPVSSTVASCMGEPSIAPWTMSTRTARSCLGMFWSRCLPIPTRTFWRRWSWWPPTRPTAPWGSSDRRGPVASRPLTPRLGTCRWWSM